MTASERRHRHERLISQRVATGVAAAAAGAVCLSIGLQWQFPVLTMPSLKEERPNAAVVTFVERPTPVAPFGPTLTRHVAPKSPVTVPIPDSTPVPAPAKPAEQPTRVRTSEQAVPAPATAPKKRPEPARIKPTTTRATASRPTPAPRPLEEEPPQPSGGEGLSRPTAGGTPSGTSDASSASVLSDTLARLTQVVNQHKRYPRRAREMGAEGTVTLGIDIDANGVVARIAILRSSNVGSLDRAAVKAAQALLGMQTSIRHAMTVQLPMQFALENR